jgi:hypothetical protein
MGKGETEENDVKIPRPDLIDYMLILFLIALLAIALGPSVRIAPTW